MLTIKPAADVPMVLAFDGVVLEVFRRTSNDRVHVAMIDKLELKADKKGQHTLNIEAVGSYTIGGQMVDASAVSKVTRLITEVEKAKGAFQFD